MIKLTLSNKRNVAFKRDGEKITQGLIQWLLTELGLTPEQKYRKLYNRMAKLCATQQWGDPFSYARSKEIMAAIELGHKVAPTLSGADAIGSNGEEYEYKSTTGKKVKGSYTGISVQSTWADQVKYPQQNKILKYPMHFFNRFENGELVESWSLTGQQVYDILLPKLEKKYPTVLQKKDPRLSADVTNTEIKKCGKRIL